MVLFHLLHNIYISITIKLGMVSTYQKHICCHSDSKTQPKRIFYSMVRVKRVYCYEGSVMSPLFVLVTLCLTQVSLYERLGPGGLSIHLLPRVGGRSFSVKSQFCVDLCNMP